MNKTTKRKNLILVSIVLLFAIALLACGSNIADNNDLPVNTENPSSQAEKKEFTLVPIEKLGYETEEITVEIPGLTEEYNIILIADLHLIVENDEIDAEYSDIVKQRINDFKGGEDKKNSKRTSAQRWENLSPVIDKCNADIVLFAGDMVDFGSEENIATLKEGLDKINTPFMYVRADHDLTPFYMTDKDGNKCYERQRTIGQMDDVWYTDLGDVIILALNNSTGEMNEMAVDEIEKITNLGKPIIILTHVPIKSIVDSSLEEASREVFGGRNLTWGMSSDDTYLAGVNNSRFLNMIYEDENSPIKEILCGHLHFSWDGYVTENTHEHVFSPAFQGKIGVIRVKSTR